MRKNYLLAATFMGLFPISCSGGGGQNQSENAPSSSDSAYAPSALENKRLRCTYQGLYENKSAIITNTWTFLDQRKVRLTQSCSFWDADHIIEGSYSYSKTSPSSCQITTDMTSESYGLTKSVRQTFSLQFSNHRTAVGVFREIYATTPNQGDNYDLTIQQAQFSL